MDDIARLLGISKKTIYTYVDDKKSLVNAVVENYVEEEQKVISNLIEQAHSAIDAMIKIAKHTLMNVDKMKPTLTYDLKKYHPTAWKFVDENHFNYIKERINQNLIRGKKEGLYRLELNEEIYSRLYIKLANSLTDGTFYETEEFDISIVYKSILHYHMNGIMTEKGRQIFNNHIKTDSL